MKHSLKEYLSTHPWINLFENPNQYASSQRPIIAHEFLFKTKKEAEEFGKACYGDYVTTVKIKLKK